MKILIITAKLASRLVKKVTTNSEHEVHVHTVNTPIAAFLTPRIIINEIDNMSSEKLESLDMIITPGLVRKDVSPIGDVTGIPTFKGSTDAADLGVVLEMIEKIDLSSKKPADKLIEEELRKRALKYIQNFEEDSKNIEKLLKKPENILVGDLPVGEDFPMRVLAEIANAPLLSPEELLKRAEYFVNSGADLVDIGMLAGETLSDEIPAMVNLLKDKLNVPISIDTLNPAEIEIAVESGVDMVLSLDHGNYEELLPILKEKKVPAVVLPSNYNQNWIPRTWEERVESLETLIQKCKGIDVIADPVLDPVNSKSIVDSFMACRKFKSKNRIPLFFGVGNVTELLDTDSTGVNSLLSGIGMELGVSILFTPEESGKTIGSVKELAVSSKMMFLAKMRGSVPKDLGINLVVFKDKRRGEILEETLDLEQIEATADYGFKQDPSGSFKITVSDGTIKAVHYQKNQPQIIITGQEAKEIYDEIIKRKLISRLEHAAYLGAELQKAEESLKLGKNYIQDFPIFNKFIEY
ncbi:MAG TPA: dihydropteroate synthase-like protein [Methanobacteriaceae archaeon]|nr:dihydropteroate synthase-like protein [Methanobacteriaceae archaeon]